MANNRASKTAAPAAAPAAKPAPKAVAAPADAAPVVRNYRARLIFKSGAVQELVHPTTNTNAFDVMRNAFYAHLAGKGQPVGQYTTNGTLVVRWTEVDSFFTWVD